MLGEGVPYLLVSFCGHIFEFRNPLVVFLIEVIDKFFKSSVRSNCLVVITT